MRVWQERAARTRQALVIPGRRDLCRPGIRAGPDRLPSASTVCRRQRGPGPAPAPCTAVSPARAPPCPGSGYPGSGYPGSGYPGGGYPGSGGRGGSRARRPAERCGREAGALRRSLKDPACHLLLAVSAGPVVRGGFGLGGDASREERGDLPHRWRALVRDLLARALAGGYAPGTSHRWPRRRPSLPPLLPLPLPLLPLPLPLPAPGPSGRGTEAGSPGGGVVRCRTFPLARPASSPGRAPAPGRPRAPGRLRLRGHG